MDFSATAEIGAMLISHPTGNANAYQAALALEEANLLREFWTCIAWRPNWLLRTLCPSSLNRVLTRRTPPQSLHRKCRTSPVREIIRHLASGLKLNSLVSSEHAPFSIDSVYRAFDATVARRLRAPNGITSVYCYEDGALETFKVRNLSACGASTNCRSVIGKHPPQSIALKNSESPSGR